MVNVDRLIAVFDAAVRTVAGNACADRPYPAGSVDEAELDEGSRDRSAALMRVNHVGEVCAQALYRGQALTARSPHARQELEAAAREEEDHLAWSARRIEELGGRPSLLNPFWYAGAFAIGTVAGALGDRTNLAFLAETERQVEEHLSGHLEKLPVEDARTKSVVDAMRADEAKHRQTALRLGATDLPAPLRLAMRVASRVMTTVAYRV